MPPYLPAMFCTAVFISMSDWPSPTSRAAAQPAATADTPVDCTGLRGGPRLTYRNPRYGFSLTHPSFFVLDPDSVPASGDSARFWTTDRRATAVVTGLRNGLGQSLSDLMREAKRDIVENGHGTISYKRIRGDWFVISGYIADRIFYRRTFLSQDRSIIATLWIEFPRDMRPCFDEAVTMMSLSFRAAA